MNKSAEVVKSYTVNSKIRQLDLRSACLKQIVKGLLDGV